jgi:hypothetical protein
VVRVVRGRSAILFTGSQGPVRPEDPDRAIPVSARKIRALSWVLIPEPAVAQRLVSYQPRGKVMKRPKENATALLTGAALAAAGRVSAKPNDQLKVVAGAPESARVDLKIV